MKCETAESALATAAAQRRLPCCVRLTSRREDRPEHAGTLLPTRRERRGRTAPCPTASILGDACAGRASGRIEEAARCPRDGPLRSDWVLQFLRRGVPPHPCLRHQGRDTVLAANCTRICQPRKSALVEGRRRRTPPLGPPSAYHGPIGPSASSSAMATSADASRTSRRLRMGTPPLLG